MAAFASRSVPQKTVKIRMPKRFQLILCSLIQSLYRVSRRHSSLKEQPALINIIRTKSGVILFYVLFNNIGLRRADCGNFILLIQLYIVRLIN